MARPMPRPSTPNDLEMTDPTLSPIPSPRQPLPTSLASFALNHSTSAPSSPSGSSSIMAIDREDFGWPPLYPPTPSFPTIRKLRRSSLLSSRPAERTDHVSSPTRSTRSGSPINTVFPSWKDEDDSPIAASPTDSSPPGAEDDQDPEPTKSEEGGLRLQTDRKTRVREMNLDSYRLSISPPSPMVDKSLDPPTTPRPLRLEPAFVPSPPSSKPIDVPKPSQVRVQPLQYNRYPPEYLQQLSSFQPYQLKPARLMAMLHESNAQETELQSEASFQRLVASHAELPLAFHPRTPRSARGRFPEEVGGDDDRRKDDDNDSDDDDDVVFGGQSGEGSVVDDSRWGSDSPAMDIEMASSSGSPSIASSVMHSQLSTPQPTSATPQSLGSMSWRDNIGVASSSGRAAKRKHVSDERFDPYAYPTKRRAVSPAVTTNSGVSHPLLHSLSSSPMSIVPRSPISQAMSPYSAASTPRGNGDGGRSVHSSPILRPVHRLPTHVREREERERAKQVNGAGDGVRGINLSS